ncbi:hypothetical protein GW17_00033720 [Ensete ventricosum]|nr:hypothetical protein GW17_00033720 [Ensete ventricosum]
MPPPPFALSHISRRRKEGKGRVPTTAALVHMLVRRGGWDPLVHEPCPSMAHGGSLRARSPRGCCDPCTFSASPDRCHIVVVVVVIVVIIVATVLPMIRTEQDYVLHLVDGQGGDKRPLGGDDSHCDDDDMCT